MNLENTVLSEKKKSDKKVHISYDSSYMKYPEKGSLWKQKDCGNVRVRRERRIKE